jgi:hypothetical protein
MNEIPILRDDDTIDVASRNVRAAIRQRGRHQITVEISVVQSQCVTHFVLGDLHQLLGVRRSEMLMRT